MSAQRPLLLTVASAVVLSACASEPVMRLETATIENPPADSARIAPADIADSATTAVGLTQPGIVEANPLFAWAGPAAPVVMVAGKYAIKSALIEGGVPAPEANHTVEVGSAFATCANVATIAGAAAPPALVLGFACGAAYAEFAKPRPPAANTATPFEPQPAD